MHQISFSVMVFTWGMGIHNTSFFFFLIYFWLRWVSVAARRLSLVAASGGYSWLQCETSHCGGFSCCGARALGTWVSGVVAHGLSSCGSQALERRLSSSAACGIFPDQSSNPCPLHWQADS